MYEESIVIIILWVFIFVYSILGFIDFGVGFWGMVYVKYLTFVVKFVNWYLLLIWEVINMFFVFVVVVFFGFFLKVVFIFVIVMFVLVMLILVFVVVCSMFMVFVYFLLKY